MCLRNAGKVRKREAAEESVSTVGEVSSVLKAPYTSVQASLISKVPLNITISA